MNLIDGIHLLYKSDRVIPVQLQALEQLKLRIWNTGFNRFEDLAQFPNLTELEIMNYRAPSLQPLRTLRRLRRLVIFHFPRVTCLEPLAELSQLPELRIPHPRDRPNRLFRMSPEILARLFPFGIHLP